VTAIAPSWDAKTATLRLWRRTGATWQPVGDAWPAALGYSGSAWGRGLHGDAAPAGRAGPIKKEGDGRTPAGIFRLTATYGYAKSGRGALPYTPVDEAWRCVDDKTSAQYDRIVDQRTVAIDWSSSEEMRRSDDLYRWVVRVAHNPTHAPGAGSCVFLHLWRKKGGVTAGCTAMARPAMERLLDALAPADEPVYVLLPAADYDALAPAWGLPKA
jgi:L,D-peptidoglycan transpeptidase YkuD (ErfK/YbiS/YcfS/YnhG family)